MSPVLYHLQFVYHSTLHMADVLTPKQRSANMAAIRGKNTKPEMVVRRLTHRLGYRYLLHERKLPGHPDLVFPSRQKAIFVHGCFWHLHDCRYGRVVPATNAVFWDNKRKGNALRDARNMESLQLLGWKVLVLWECETKDLSALAARIRRFLGRTGHVTKRRR
jgi:DNA mismatch endonuclease (patch repair protein)